VCVRCRYESHPNWLRRLRRVEGHSRGKGKRRQCISASIFGTFRCYREMYVMLYC
jgi:hypothetical protein